MFSMTTLGKFQMTDEKIVLDEDAMRSKKLTNLLAYMMLHREKTLTLDDMAEALWQEEETSNPAGALKNLMYRLRMVLKQNFGEGEFILNNRGAYCFNPDIEVKVDAEEFEKLYRAAKQKGISKEQAVTYLEQAIALFGGDFMPKMTEMHWVVSLNTYYHSLYLESVKLLAQLYGRQERYEQQEQLCIRALSFDHLEEDFYYYLILAKAKRGHLCQAIDFYEKTCGIFRDELGISVSAKLKQLYEELLKKIKTEETENMPKVKEAIREENPMGVFMCGYPVFREICRLEARKSAKGGQAEHLLLLTVSSKEEQKGSLADKFRVKNAMLHLEKILNECLGMGDAVSQYSNSQYVVLLSFCSYQNGMVVANRIVSKFNQDKKRHPNLQIQINLEKIGTDISFCQKIM